MFVFYITCPRVRNCEINYKAVLKMLVLLLLCVAASCVLLAFLVVRVYTVPTGTQAVIERLGVFRCVLNEGTHLLLEWFDKPVAIDHNNERTTNIPIGICILHVKDVECVSQDGYSADSEILITFHINDARELVYKNIRNVDQAVTRILSATYLDVVVHTIFKDMLVAPNIVADEILKQMNAYYVRVGWPIIIQDIVFSNIRLPSGIREQNAKMISLKHQRERFLYDTETEKMMKKDDK